MSVKRGLEKQWPAQDQTEAGEVTTHIYCQRSAAARGFRERLSAAYMSAWPAERLISLLQSALWGVEEIGSLWKG